MAAFAQLLGGQTLMAAFVRVHTTAKSRAGHSLRMAAEEIMADSKRMAPVEFGRLRGTGYVRRESLLSIVLGYNTEYALFVHEVPPPGGPAGDDPPQWRPGDRTAYHNPPTQWKFLEKPARARWENIETVFSPLSGINWPHLF